MASTSTIRTPVISPDRLSVDISIPGFPEACFRQNSEKSIALRTLDGFNAVHIEQRHV